MPTKKPLEAPIVNGQNRPIVPVILAGGQGVRLRPVTSKKRAKPFLKAGGKCSLFQQTLRRASVFDAPIIVGRAQDEKRILEECAALNITPRQIILEPCSRNTAPAIAAAALSVADENPHLLIMPSDHAVPEKDNAYFATAVQRAAMNEGFTVLGITPRKPSNQYGYIIQGPDGTAKNFTEKPTRRTAVSLIQDQNALWHSGMFTAPAHEVIQAFKRFAPDILGAMHFAMKAARRHEHVIYPCVTQFTKSPANSIDYAILENLDHLCVARLDMGWNDVGSLPAYITQSLRNWLKS